MAFQPSSQSHLERAVVPTLLKQLAVRVLQEHGFETLVILLADFKIVRRVQISMDTDSGGQRTARAFAWIT
jgi:hypothetical protein